jgi:hypothetical protein
MNRDSERSLPEVIAEAAELLTKFSIPLYVNDKYQRPVLFGTGFFVRAADDHFLVSAAHVLDVARTQRVFFYVTPSKLRALTGSVLTTGLPDKRDDDLLDIGVMKLSGEAAPSYPEVEKFAMDASYLTPNYLPRSGKHYVIVGFPATKSVVDSRGRTTLAAPYAYRSDAIDDRDYAAHGVDAKTHVVLPLNLKRGFDAAGRIVNFPKPQGMSGSPIVVLYGEPGSEGNSRVFPVVAVGTRYRRKTKVLIGTDVRFAVGAIEGFLRESGPAR